MRPLAGAVRTATAGPGLWAAACAIVAQRLLHSAFPAAPFAPYSIAEWAVRKSPGALATYAIDHLGHRALPTFGYAFIALALAIGLIAGRRPAWMLAAIAFLLTLLAAFLDPIPRGVTPALSSASVAALTALSAAIAFRPRERDAPPPETDWTRRRLLARAGLGMILVGVGGAAAVRQGSRSAPSGFVRADEPAIVPFDGAFAEVDGLSPRVTPRADHYVVDIDLENPLIGQSGWRLHVNGEVESPISMSLADLQSMRTVERLFNVSCISNPVGGDLIGNSRWTGVPLDHLLDLAAPLASAVALRVRSFDGYSEGIPLNDIRGHDALIAIGMNGRLLPRSHGFPARLLFPDHYGMRSVKWVTDLVLLDRDEEGYWAQRGWDREAVVRTESRFDAPRDGDRVARRFVCAGIAWAGARGIAAVEVSADGGQSWRQAELEGVLSPLSWRRWRIELELAPGVHTLAVRATDGTGSTQEAKERDPHPSGASGYHRIEVSVGAA